MKKLLIPIDFSECSMNAVKYGIELAKVMEAEIIICHSFAVPIPSVTDTLPGIQRKYLELEEDLNSQLNKISQEISSHIYTNGNQLKCSYFIIQSGPTEGVVHFASQFFPDFIIMGTVGNNGWENILGSTTVGTIRKINIPVIVVSSSVAYTQIKDILISIDFPIHNINSINQVLMLAKLFKARIQFCHVSSNEEDERNEREKLNHFKEECYKSGIGNIDFHTILSSQAGEAIIDFIETNNFQLVALLKERRAFFEGLFHQSFIKQLVMDCKRPLLILTDE